MNGRNLVKLLNAKSLTNLAILDKEYEYGFATDLMSDALAMIQESTETTMLITGLCNDQALRTAEMLDIDLIIFVRGKALPTSMVELSSIKNINVLMTDMSMYETCGVLYEAGVRALSNE